MAELHLDRREGEADHAAAEHLGLQSHLVRRPHHADGIRRVGGDVDHVGVGRLDRADDRRVVRGVRRIGLVIDHLEPELLHGLPRALQGVLRVFRVGAHQRDGLRLRVHGHRRLQEALGRSVLGVGAVGQDLEIAGIVEGVVHPGAEERHEHQIALHHDRHRRRDLVGGVGGDHEVDLVDLQELGVDARHRRRVRLVVVEDSCTGRPSSRPWR